MASVLRGVIESIETILVAQGYTRAELNFTLDHVPDSVGHKRYTFGIPVFKVNYQGNNLADYEDTIWPVMILWRIRTSENSDGTQQEALLDLLDAIEILEDALVKGQLAANDDNNLFDSIIISEPTDSSAATNYLMLTINIAIDTIREMD